MERHSATELQHIKDRILGMGGWVELAAREASSALIQRSPQRLKRVYEIEAKINQAHIDIDELCLQFLALQAPVAADLRLVLAVIKINTDLERMGDQAVNIAYNTLDYLGRVPSGGELAELESMAQAVAWMIKSSLDSFTRPDTELAARVLKADDAVDEFKNKIFRALTQTMRDRPEVIESCLDLILVARNLERLGDHATNIAEDTIFAYTGRDIRHKLGGSHV